MEIDHVVLWVEDARRSLEFYTRVLGFEAVRAEEFLAGTAPFPSVRIAAHSILDLMPAMAAPFAAHFTGEKKPTAAGKPLNHVCLAMNKSELDSLASRLAAAEIPTHKIGETSFGARGSSKHWFYFQDLDGNVLEARHYED
jgi:catechol 2,3-dioxygenase-like lactoylglutathione lyase family enzyme